MRKLLIIVLLALTAVPQVLAAGSDRKKQTTEVVMTEPDVLPVCPRPEKRVHEIAQFSPRHNTKRRPTELYGIDVSHYQGNIDWKEVAADGNVSYVYLKATESSSLVDNTYRRNLEGCKRNKLPVGVYHFFSPTASAESQLENFRRTVDPRDQDLIPIVDVEKVAKNNLPAFRKRLKTFLDGVEKTFGVKPLIYTGVNFYHKYLMGEFSGYKYMVARYDEEMPEFRDALPYILWQFTQSGRIRGIRGSVDRSCFIHPHNINDIKYKYAK